MANLRPYNNHKLQFRSKQCVFLGYSNLHKGYKCLDISTGRVYISRDVVFDEDIFPFAQLHPNAGTRLQQEIFLFSPHLLNDNGVMNSSFSNTTNDLPDPCELSSDDTGPGSQAGPPNFVSFPLFADPGQVQLPTNEGTAPNVDSGVDFGVDQTLQTTVSHDSPSATPTLPAVVPPPTIDGDLTVLPSCTAPGTSTACPISPRAPLDSGVAAPGCPTPAAATGESSLRRRFPPPPPGPARPVHGPIRISPNNRPRTRLQDNIHKPKVFHDGTVRYGFLSELQEPASLRDALASDHWQDAMHTEFDALLRNDTWHLVPPKPGQNIIDCK